MDARLKTDALHGPEKGLCQAFFNPEGHLIAKDSINDEFDKAS